MSYEKLSDYDFNLPDELIATHPAEPRDHSRLLVLDKKTGKIEHRHFYDFIDYLRAGDVLVLNNSKVIPARLWARKRQECRPAKSCGSTVLQGGGKVQVLLHKKLNRRSPEAETAAGQGGDIWQCLIGGKAKEGLELVFTITHPASLTLGTPLDRGELTAKVLKNNHDGTWDLKFNKSGAALMKVIERIGETPLPSYIVNQRKHEVDGKPPLTPPWKGGESAIRNDKNDYQTVFADDKKAGSVAAPTAGLHFTPELLRKIKNKGVKILEITLYVGMGTFAPVKVDDFTKHKMHAEWVEIEKKVIAEINRRNAISCVPSARVIAVGTTSARSLEACWQTSPQNIAGLRNGFKAWVDIFIYPGYKFKIVDAMITNFHLPKSTLLMLISALAGKKNIDQAYQEAIKKKYRFYSYGDAMFIK
jgi:S-adenosylmethionine:tRNA ribosyltransferase-isomerase